MLYFSFWVLFVGSSVREISWRDLGKRTGDVECRNYLKPPSNSSKNKFWICLGSQSTAYREYNILYLWPRSKCWVWANKANIQHAATKVTNIGYYIPCGRLLCCANQDLFIFSRRSKMSCSIYCGGFRSPSSHANHVFSGKPRSFAISSAGRFVFVLASLIVIKVPFYYKKITEIVQIFFCEISFI